MRTPLIRQGSGEQGLAHVYDQLEEQSRNLSRMIDTAAAPDDTQEQRRKGLKKVAGRSAAGDEKRLRAIPVTTEGVAAFIPGTQPERAIAARARKRGHTNVALAADMIDAALRSVRH